MAILTLLGRHDFVKAIDNLNTFLPRLAFLMAASVLSSLVFLLEFITQRDLSPSVRAVPAVDFFFCTHFGLLSERFCVLECCSRISKEQERMIYRMLIKLLNVFRIWYLIQDNIFEFSVNQRLCWVTKLLKLSKPSQSLGTLSLLNQYFGEARYLRINSWSVHSHMGAKPNGKPTSHKQHVRSLRGIYTIATIASPLIPQYTFLRIALRPLLLKHPPICSQGNRRAKLN